MKIKLFCVPYAGGSSYMYYPWQKKINKNIELVACEYPGRGKKCDIDLLDSIEHIVEDLYPYIKKECMDNDFAFFGHSMGSIVCYELIRKLNADGLTPMHAFFSGCSAPNRVREKEPIHLLEGDDFVEALRKLGGTPKEIYENKDLMEYYFPILKSDFRAVETYSLKHQDIELDCNITILNGDEDDLKEVEILEWSKFTHCECRYENFKGDHFFIQQYESDILELIEEKLQVDRKVCVG